ncbi:hypothetical protein ES815_03215 [Leclercia adecarboxylata]|uniref:Uncharacterized protein n=1 Tax=Leclercia adecarboxylata TaxID=83655 RepID=A0AAP9D9R8_9ENTR|nr:hypothetical protein [Leclercia adecarboxylata]QDK17372.1 hypothetical protein ES815_03215 [Leclercia adecarboxylata]
MLCDFPTERIELCRLIVDLVRVIAKQDRANLDVLRLMTNRDGNNTTPGTNERQAALFEALWGEKVSTKNESEKYDVIQSIMNGWPLELSFQVGCEIIRHWAKLEYAQRSKKNKNESMRILEIKIICEWNAHPNRWATIADFIRYIERLDWEDTPTESKIRSTIKNHLNQ